MPFSVGPPREPLSAVVPYGFRPVAATTGQPSAATRARDGWHGPVATKKATVKQEPDEEDDDATLRALLERQGAQEDGELADPEGGAEAGGGSFATRLKKLTVVGMPSGLAKPQQEPACSHS